MKRRKPDSLRNVLDSVLTDQGYIDQYYKFDLIKKWPSIVGERIAAVTECSELKNDVLYVRVSSSAWRQEISFLKAELIKKIKKETRCKKIKDIVFC